MLTKLLKYDLKNIFKFLIVFYALAIFFALLARLFFSLNDTFILNILAQVCAGAAISMFVSILINNVMRMWVKFKNGLYGDESYLTHTLPVQKSSTYLAKTYAAVISFLVSFIVIVLTLYITYYSKENISALKNFLLPVAKMYDISVEGIILLALALIFLQFLTILKCGFLGLIYGNKKNNHRLVWSFVYGFISYLVVQILGLRILYIIALFSPAVMDLFTTNKILDVRALQTLIYGGMACYFISLIILTIINIRALNKGVDVE